MKPAFFIAKIKFCFLLIGFACASANAQMVGENVFFKGDYLEFSINGCGVYASDTIQPFGYQVFNADLGIISDSGKDGWGVGIDCGDYVIPGAEIEGFGIQIGDSLYFNDENNCTNFDIPGSTTFFDSVSILKESKWEGYILSQNLSVEQTTKLNTEKVYFLTTVKFCNDGAADIHDLYYLRQLDPDPDNAPTCDIDFITFVTRNIIVKNPPLTDTALLHVYGLECECLMGICSIDPRARVSHGNFQVDEGTPYDAWNGLDGYALSDTAIGDIAVEISFKLDIPAGGCDSICFAYFFNESEEDEALYATSVCSVDTISPCEQDAFLEVTDTTFTTALISWNEHPLVNYDLLYRISGAPEWDTLFDVASPFELTDLEICTYYEYMLMFTCDSLLTDSASGAFKTECQIEIQEQSITPGNLIIFPNPAGSSIYIKAELFEGAGSLELLSVTGELIQQFNVMGSDIELNTGDLPPGFYFIRLRSNIKLAYGSFIKN